MQIQQFGYDYRFIIKCRDPVRIIDVSAMGLKYYNTPHQYFIAHLNGLVDLRRPAQRRIGAGQFPQDPVGALPRDLFDTETEASDDDVAHVNAGPSQPDADQRPFWPMAGASGRLLCPNCHDVELTEGTGRPGQQRSCYGVCNRELRQHWLAWQCACNYCCCLRCLRGR